jgi:polar amino acid transport system permease protein
MKKAINYALAISIFLALIVYVIIARDANFTLEPLYENYGGLIYQGLLNTLYVSLISLVGSLILGFIMYILSISKSFFFYSRIYMVKF